MLSIQQKSLARPRTLLLKITPQSSKTAKKYHKTLKTYIYIYIYIYIYKIQKKHSKHIQSAIVGDGFERNWQT